MTDTVRAAALTDTAAAMIDRPPSRSRLPQRRLPPTQEPRPRPGPSQHGRLRMTPELVKFHLATTDQFSVAVDTLPISWPPEARPRECHPRRGSPAAQPGVRQFLDFATAS